MKDIMIITGASSGLGFSLAKLALQRDLLVCGIARDKDRLQKAQQQLGSNFIYFSCDIANQQQVEETISTISQLGNIKYVVNNGQSAIFRDVIDYSQDDIETSLKGLKGMMFVSQATLKIKKQTDIKIINIGSSASFAGKGKESVYCAIKWAVRGYTESLKDQYKNSSVKIIGVYPGGMNTNFWNDSRDYMPIEKTDKFMNSDDVAKAIIDNILNDDVYVSDIRIAR